MGVNKLGDGNKDYAEGYAAGFAAGVAAWFAATGDVRHKFPNPGSNVMEPATGTNNAAEGSHALESSMDVVKAGKESAHPANITEDLNLLHSGSHALELSMDIEKPGEERECLATVTEEDLNLSYPRSSALESPADAVKLGEKSKHLDTVTEEDLGHVAPGCFVRVGSGDTSYWVEIGQIEGVTISGIVHPELSTSLCVINHDSCEIARFSRNQITALGCDRYCWC
jgi:hypothetical protein